MKMINFKKNKMKLLAKEQQELYENAKICYIYKERNEDKYKKEKKIVRLEIIVITQENVEVLHVAYVI